MILSLGWWSPSPPSQTFLDSPLGLLPQPFPCVASKELRLCQTGSSWIQLRPLSSLDWLFDILMSSLWLPLCNLSPVVLLALYRGGGLSSFSIQHFPVAKRLTGESSPWVAGQCPYQLSFTWVTPRPQLAACIPLGSPPGVQSGGQNRRSHPRQLPGEKGASSTLFSGHRVPYGALGPQSGCLEGGPLSPSVPWTGEDTHSTCPVDDQYPPHHPSSPHFLPVLWGSVPQPGPLCLLITSVGTALWSSGALREPPTSGQLMLNL